MYSDPPIPIGSIIFINSWFSPTGHINPSEDKHVAIYLGSGLLNKMISTRGRAVANICNDVPYVIESTAIHGVRIVPLYDAIDKSEFKIYILDIINGKNLMERAAAESLDLVGMPYGFGSNGLYCFKVVADSYHRVGVDMVPTNILGREIILSQNFTRDRRWKKIYDSRDVNRL